MKKQFKRALAFFIAVMMVFSTVVFTANAAVNTLSAFTAKLNEFKSNRYGNDSTYVDDPGNTGGYSCFGFANEVAKYIFGSYPTISMGALTMASNEWERTYGGAAVDSLAVGDIVRYYKHSIFITGISGDTITYCDANVDGKNTVAYGTTISRSDLKYKVSRSLTHDGATTTGWVAHFKNGLEGVISTTTPTTPTTITLTYFNDKISQFKSNRYSNNSTYVDDPGNTGGYSSFGFANEVAKYIFGSYPTISMGALTMASNEWERTYGGVAVDSLAVGDIVRYYKHSIFITGISGDTITYCDANVDGENTVAYGTTISRSDLKYKVSRSLTHDGATTTGWVAHFKNGLSPSVAPTTVAVTGVSIDTSSRTMAAGANYQIYKTVYPSNATNKSVTWSSSNSNIARVSSDGTVTAVREGTATITVKTDDGGYTASCQITVIIPVKSISLNVTSYRMDVGNSFTLYETINPSDATNQSVTWSSSDTSVATVSYYGRVTAVGGGTATITARTVDGDKTATCRITVNVPVTSVELDKSHMEINVGETALLWETVYPSNATNKSVTWSSSDANIARVSSDGIVTAVGAGTATITVKTDDGDKIAKCTVSVTEPYYEIIDRVEIAYSYRYCVEGEVFVVPAEVITYASPNQLVDTSLTWTSSDESVAKISQDGTLIALSEGSTTITATSNLEGKSDTCEIEVVAIGNLSTVSVDNVKTTVDGTVKVPVRIYNNPGVVIARLYIDYDDSLLELVGVEDGGILGTQMHSYDYSKNPYTLYWNNGVATSNYIDDGIIATLEFKVKSCADIGIYKIGISYSEYDYDVIDKDFESVGLYDSSGSIEVIDFVYADADNDGRVTNKDSAIVARHLANWPGYEYYGSPYNFAAADVDCDGRVTNKDSAIIARHLARWTGYEALPKQ